MLDIPVTTKYAAVLNETETLKAEQIIDIARASYINKLINRQCGTEILWKLLDRDNEDIVKRNFQTRNWKNPQFRTSIKGHLATICEKYGLPNPIECKMSSEHIKCIIKNKSSIVNWREASDGKLNIKRNHHKTKDKHYHRMNKWAGRNMLLWRCGMLRFRGNWRRYYNAKKIDATCPFPFCDQLDLYQHATVCQFSNVSEPAHDPNVVEDVRIFRYLQALNSERVMFHRPFLC